MLYMDTLDISLTTSIRELISKLVLYYLDSIVFIDGDNSLNHINLDFNPEIVHYVVFLSIHSKTKIHKRVRPDISYVLSQTGYKDSCDLCMCMTVCMLHLRLPKDIRFRFVSSDHFIKELNIISELGRPIDVIFRNDYVTSLCHYKFIQKESFDKIRNNRQLKCILFVADYVTISLNQINELRYRKDQLQVIFFTRKNNSFPHINSDILINVEKKRDVIFSVSTIASMLHNMVDNSIPFIFLSNRILRSYDEILCTLSSRHTKIFDNICNPNFAYLMIHYLVSILNVSLSVSEYMTHFIESIDYNLYYDMIMKNRYILSYKSSAEAEVARRLLDGFENGTLNKSWFISYYDLRTKTLDKWLNNINVKSHVCYEAGDDYLNSDVSIFRFSS